MKKQHLFIILSVVLLGFVFGIIQYYQALKTEDVSAVTVGIPNPGHSLAQLECSADSLCVDTVNNRVGIGTANPGDKLEVVAGTSAVGIKISGSNYPSLSLVGSGVAGGQVNFISSTNSWSIYNQNGDLKFYTSGDKAAIQSNGNVGIGTTSPNNKLTITSSITGDGIGQSSSSYISVPNTYTTLFTLSNRETVVFLVNVMCDYLNGYSYLLMATGSSYNGGSLTVISGPTGYTGGSSMSFQISGNSIQAKENYSGLTQSVNVIVLTRSIF